MTFAPDVVSAVLAHMNDDHTDDSLAIVRAFGAPGASSAVMSDLDAEAGEWIVTTDGVESRLRIPWPIPVVERTDLRRAVVALHDAATSGPRAGR